MDYWEISYNVHSIIFVYLFFFFKENPDIDGVIEDFGQSEGYILSSHSSERRVNHLVVDNVYMFSCGNVQDAVIDFMCFYYVLDICYPKMMNSLLFFIQHFIFSLTTGVVPPCVINLCSKLQ